MSGKQLFVAPPPIEGLGQLETILGEVADFFDDLKKRWPQIQIPKYREQVAELTTGLNKTCDAYQTALNQAAEESSRGANVARDAVDLVNQLLDPERQAAEIGQLLENLIKRINDSMVAANQLKKEFLYVRQNLLYAREMVPPLVKGIESKKSFFASIRKLFGGNSSGSREKRVATAQTALTALKGIEPGLDRAIAIASNLVEYWSTLSVSIKATRSDQLLRMNQEALQKCRKSWREIERLYNSYSSQASLASQRLETTPPLQVK